MLELALRRGWDARARGSDRGRGASRRAVQGGDVLRASPGRPARPSPAPPGPAPRSPRARRRRALARGAAAPPRSRCCRTGCRGSRAPSAGWSGSTIGAPRSVSSARGEHRPGVDALAAGRGGAGLPSRSSGETKRPPSTSATTWVESRLDRSASAALDRFRARPVDGCRVVDAERTRAEPVAVDGLGAQPRPPAIGPVALERELERLAPAREQVGERRWRQLDPALGAFVALARGLEEADGPRDLGTALGRDHALHPQVVEGRGAALGVGRRIDDPERGRGRVLGRARRVGVERVALVQQRVDEARGRGVHQPSSSRSASIVASKVGRPRSALSASSRSNVSASSGTQRRNG